MGAADFANPGSKIKGGKKTVVKFFFVSVGYTCVWMAQCSELGFYRKLYGPSVLLKMNIMYYLPSIPLLGLSSLLDERLDNQFGVAKTVLMRLIIGMGGCFLIAVVFPTEPNRLGLLLGTIGALGMAHGISFSASYQLVARFANKQTISLGLGCVGSGGLVLAAEVALRMGTNPSEQDEVLLYGTCAALVLLGVVSAVSLLIRHWRSIEAASAPADELEKAVSPMHEALLESDAELEGGSPHSQAAGEPSENSMHRRHAGSGNLGALVAISPLDFFKSVSDGDTTLLLDRHSHAGGGVPGNDLWHATVQAERGGLQGRSPGRSGHGGSHSSLRGSSPRPPAEAAISALWPAQTTHTSQADPEQGSGGAAGQQRPPAAAGSHLAAGARSGRPDGASQLSSAHAAGEQGRELLQPPYSGRGGDSRSAGANGSGASSPSKAAFGSPRRHRLAEGMIRVGSATSTASLASAARQDVERASANALDTMRRMWPVQAGLFTSGTIGLTVFPFCTYVPTSGALGAMLPKWLFFVRLFADLTGRLLPRLKWLALQRQSSILALGLLMLALTPLFFLYIALAPPWLVSDALACAYMALLFLLNGYVNTNAMMAPKTMPPHQRAAAAGILAVTYQAAHCAGLLLGTGIVLLFLGGF